jgi:hypothetical protein
VTFFSREVDSSQYFNIGHPSAGHGLVVAQPVRRVLRSRGSDGTLEVLSGQLQGFFESVYAVDATHAVSLDAFARHDIDLTAPDAPKVVTTPMAGSQPARLVLGRTPEIGVWISSDILDAGPPKYFDLASITEPQGLTPHGRVRIDAARSATSGDELVGVTFDRASDRFR